MTQCRLRALPAQSHRAHRRGAFSSRFLCYNRSFKFHILVVFVFVRRELKKPHVTNAQHLRCVVTQTAYSTLETRRECGLRACARRGLLGLHCLLPPSSLLGSHHGPQPRWNDGVQRESWLCAPSLGGVPQLVRNWSRRQRSEAHVSQQHHRKHRFQTETSC